MRVVGLCGSLRKASCNGGLLRSFEEVLKTKHGIILEVVPIGGLPLFNEDLEASSCLASVKAFRESLAKADGMVFATCEYNASISAALKNARCSRLSVMFCSVCVTAIMRLEPRQPCV